MGLKMNSAGVAWEVEDDGGILHSVTRLPSGRYSGEMRVYGRVVIEGVEYEFDRCVKVAMKKQKEPENNT
jgi:hypothetical protein